MIQGPQKTSSPSAVLAAEAAGLLLRAQHDAAARVEAEAWAAQSPEHAEVWAAAQRLGVASGLQRGIIKGQQRRRRRRSALIGTGMAAAMAVVVAWPSLRATWRGDLRSATAEIRVAQLPDGSTTVLDAGSTLVPSRSAGVRGGALLQGRAYFDVAKDATRPFRVSVEGLEVTAIGTAFTVEKFAHATDVALAQGSVEIRAKGQHLRLQPGDRVRLADNGALERHHVAPAAIGAWRHGQLALQDAAIEDMVDALRPHYRGMIMVSTSSLRAQRITGVFDLHDPARALRAAVEPFGGRVRQLSPWVLMVSGPA